MRGGGHEEERSHAHDSMIKEEDIPEDRYKHTAQSNTQSQPPTPNDSPSQYVLSRQQELKREKM